MPYAKSRLNEDGAPTNAVGGGGVEGIGYGLKGEPGQYKKKKTQVLKRREPKLLKFSQFFNFQPTFKI